MRNSKEKKEISSNKKGFLRLAAFSVIVIYLFCSLSSVFNVKDASDSTGMSKNVTTAYRAEGENTIDVVFIGNSNAYRSFNPIQLWEERQITSCVISGPMMRVDQVYSYIKDICKTQKPKQIVLEANCLFFYLDTNGLSRGEITAPAYPYIASVNAKTEIKIPEFSYDKDYLKNGAGELEDALMSRVAYNASLMKYHDRWQSLSSYDFLHTEQQYYYVAKGFLFSNLTVPFTQEDIYMKSEDEEQKKISTFNRFYFQKLYDFCSENGMTLSIVAVPSGTNWSSKRHDCVEELAMNYSLDFVDFNTRGTLDEEIDWLKDSKDGGDHMNTKGARKITSTYGRLLTEKFNISPSVLTDEQKARWKNDSKRYHNEIEKK